MKPAFDVHPLLLLVLGPFLAVVLVRQLRFSAFGRTWWLLPLSGLALVPAAAWQAWRGPVQNAGSLLTVLLLGLAGIRCVRLLTGERDREVLELYLMLPALAWLPLLFPELPGSFPLPPFLQAVLAPLAWLGLALGLIFLLSGAQEKFRLNRSPASVEGLPFRLALIGFFLLFWECFRLLDGGAL